MTFKKKMSKRTDSKRVECPGLSSEKVDEIRQSFYKHISDLDIPDEERNGEISFDVFLDAINNKWDDKESKEGIRKIFDLFICDPNADTITLSSLKKNRKNWEKIWSMKNLRLCWKEQVKMSWTHLLYKVITITWTNIGLAFFRSHSR